MYSLELCSSAETIKLLVSILVLNYFNFLLVVSMKFKVLEFFLVDLMKFNVSLIFLKRFDDNDLG